MTTHSMAITLVSKIPAVLNGTCRQTIRKIKKSQDIQPGDKIIFICISGRMHRWKSWQKTVWVDRIYPFKIYIDHFEIFGRDYTWDSSMAAVIAVEDSIESKNGEILGEALRDVLFKVIGVPGKDGTRCQIIRW